MADATIRVQVDRQSGGAIRVLSPGVGFWLDPPRPGTLLEPGSRIGLFGYLNSRMELRLPDGAAGRMSGPLPVDRSVPVEFGQTLCTLLPIEHDVENAGANDAHRPAGEVDTQGEVRVFVAPTDGIFYRGPAPGAAPFVEKGSRIRLGGAVGMVEVMKTFSRIFYEGPGLPDPAEVVEIRCGDGREVRAGQTLIVVRAAR